MLYNVTLLSPKDGRKNRWVKRFAVAATSAGEAEATVRRIESVHVEDYTVYGTVEPIPDDCTACGYYTVPCNHEAPND